MRSFKEYRQEFNEEQVSVAPPNLSASLIQLQDSLVSMVNRLSQQTIEYLDVDVEDNPLNVMRQNLSWKQKLGNWWNRVWHGNDHASKREATEYDLEFPDEVLIEQESFDELVELILLEYGPVNQARENYTNMIQRMNSEINRQIRSQFKIFITNNKDLLSGKTKKNPLVNPVAPSPVDTGEQPGDLNAAAPQSRPKATTPQPDPRPFFDYEALDSHGKTVKGTIHADSHREAIDLLKAKGLFVTNLSGEPEKELTSFHFVGEDENGQEVKGVMDASSRLEAMQLIKDKYKNVRLKWVDEQPQQEPSVVEPEESHPLEEPEQDSASQSTEEPNQEEIGEPEQEEPEELNIQNQEEPEEQSDDRKVRDDIIVQGINRITGSKGYGLVKSVDIDGKNYRVAEASYDHRGTLKWVTLVQKKFAGIISIPEELGEKYGADPFVLKGARTGLVTQIQSDIVNGVPAEVSKTDQKPEPYVPTPKKDSGGVSPPNHGSYNIAPSNSHEVPEMDPEETDGDIDQDAGDNDDVLNWIKQMDSHAKEWDNMTYEGRINRWLERLKERDEESFEAINPKFFHYLNSPDGPEKDAIMAFISGLSERWRSRLLNVYSDYNKTLDSIGEDLGKLQWVAHLPPEKAEELGVKLNKNANRIEDILASPESLNNFINEEHAFTKEHDLVIKETIKNAEPDEQVKRYKRKLKRLSQ